MIAQIFIAVFGVTATWLSQDANVKRRKYSCLFGMAGQPFWFYAAYTSGQWGIFGLCFLYSFSWLRGFKQYWIDGGGFRLSLENLKERCMQGANLTGAAQGVGSLGGDSQQKNQGECMAIRDMTVVETINARIENLNRQISNLMVMRDSTPHNVLSQPIHHFERLYGTLFSNRPTY